MNPVEPNDPGHESADALWLATLQRIAHRAAHELKGALNGASVNLEVVRSRATKPEVAASAVSSFAVAAQSQLENVITMTDALLSLAREAAEPVDLAPVVRRMNALLGPATKAGGRVLEVSALDQLGTTSASGNAVRLVIGACLLSATEVSTNVRCESVNDYAQPTLRIESCDGVVLPCDDVLMAVAVGAGIQIQVEANAISISFPR